MSKSSDHAGLKETAPVGRVSIVKVQVALNGAGPILIYDEARRHTTQQPPEAYITQALKGHAKGYFEGSWDEGNQRWIIGARVSAQSW